MNLIKQSAFLFGLKWSLMPLDFIIGALVARSIGPEGRGVILLFGGISTVIMGLADLRPSRGAIYYYKQGKYNIGEIVFSSFLLIIIPSSIILILFYFFQNNIFELFVTTSINPDYKVSWIWILIFSSLVNISFLFINPLLIRDNEMKLYGIQSLAPPLTRIAFTIILVLVMSWGVLGALWSILLAKFISICVPIYWLVKNDIFRQLSFSLSATKGMFKIGFQQYVIEIFTLMAKKFDVFFIAAILSIRDLGFFSIAWGVINVFKTIPISTMWPLVSKLVSQDKRKVDQFAQVTRIQFTIMLITMALFAPIVPAFIYIFYGQAYIPATGAVLLILPSLIFMPFKVCGDAYFTSKGQPGKTLVPFILATFLQILISIILVPKIGVLGSAIGVSAHYIFFSGAMIYLIVNETNINTYSMIIMTRRDWSITYLYLKRLLSNQYKKLKKR